MLGDITQAKNVYIVCGRTDMRKGIRGLAALVQQNYQMDPTDSSLFLFCGKSRSQGCRPRPPAAVSGPVGQSSVSAS